jgi:predicted nuclease of restriction endonuclease-like (RecB) superfamily
MQNATGMEPEKSISNLYVDICKVIENARIYVAQTANSSLTIMYWEIGKRINAELIIGERAAYGKQIVSQLATKLQMQFGERGFQERNIRRMIQFNELFSDFQIVSQAATKLSWSHFIELISLKDELKREFYLTMSINENWGRNTLREKIDGMLYERTMISGKSKELIKKELNNMRSGATFSPDLIFKSPYFLDFAGLKGMYSEKSLEDSLITSLEQFIMELGVGFTFVERQKRMIIDGEDFYLDLLFYHRKLKRLIAIELKLGKFKASYKGQMELYLRWLDKYEKQEGEETPLGLILCAEGGYEQIELLQLEKAGIKVAEYLTELPDRQLLKDKLHQELEIKRQLFNQNTSKEQD